MNINQTPTKIIKQPESIQAFDNDEYEELSYKCSKATPISSKPDVSDDNTDTNGDNPPKKKSFEKDFRVKYKTEKCKFFELNRECKYKDNVLYILNKCAFAHGVEDMREKSFVSNNYKTKQCKQFFEQGHCPYGLRCQFLHKFSSKNSDSPQVSYSKIMNELINSTDTLSIVSNDSQKR
jgi:hypothetical protein